VSDAVCHRWTPAAWQALNDHCGRQWRAYPRLLLLKPDELHEQFDLLSAPARIALGVE
jgi:hypothetical protein